VDPSIHKRFEDILPSGGLLTDPQTLEPYRRDGSARSSLPSAVLLPRTTDQVQKIVQLAHEERLPLTLRGGGTGLRGGAVAPEGGVVLSLSRMDRVLEVSPENSLAVVQPGISARRLEKHLEDSGWFYPVDPAGWRCSTIGGDVATRAHGLREARYGPIGNHLLGLEAIISPGEIIRCGARTLKCATGYHLVDLFAGSRGRLGVITQIILKLTPRPPVRRTLTAVIEDLDAAARTAGCVRRAGLQPVRLELIGPQAAREGLAGLADKEQQDGYLLMMELEDETPEDVDEQIGRAGSCFREHAGVRLQAIRPEEEDSAGAAGRSGGCRERAPDWWRRRGDLLRRLTADDRPSLLATLRIPASRLADFRKRAAGILETHACGGSFWGHLGEGRWHLLVHRLQEQPGANEALGGVSRSLEETAADCGGLYLPPLPLGWTPQESLIARRDSGQGRLWKALKNRFDPLELFGPID
jgi:FAD/FMN-containing dehydrogenase